MKRLFPLFGERLFLFILMVALVAVPLVSHAQKPEMPIGFDYVLEANTADASGSLVSASTCAGGSSGGLANYAFFSADGLPVIVYATLGYNAIYSKDGARSGEYTLASGSSARLYGYARVNNSHYACVKVVAWSKNSAAAERYLWVGCLGSSQPAFVPAHTERNLFEHGPAVCFETGIPNAEVLLTDEVGTPITTAMSDEDGLVIFDDQHTADGRSHLTYLTWTFGDYNYHAATAYATSHLLPTVGGSDHEWVQNNSCATFQSRVLSGGGFPVYAPYTEGANNPGQGLFATLKLLIGDAYCKKEFTIDDFHEGDIIWIRNMGHAMYCSAINREEGTVHAYAHSTSATSGYTDDCWIPITDISAVAQMVTVDEYGHDYRINGVANPRQVLFESNGGTGTMERLILGEGETVALPACEFDPPSLMAFAGWEIEGETYAAGQSFTVEDHMTLTACWTDAIRLGIADLVLPSSLTEIADGAFEGIAAVTVYIPDGCGSIGAGAFAACHDLRQVRIPDGCTIDPSAFSGCSAVTLFGSVGGTAEAFCNAHPGFTFMEE